MKKFFKFPMRKNGAKGFSLAETSVVFVILGVVTAIIARLAFTTPQKQFDAKYNRISADITSNIAKGISSKTGFRFSNYRTDNDTFVNDITSNLKGSAASIAADWSDNVTPEANVNIRNYTAYKMDNEAVLAINNTGTDIYVDVNGKKGPNTLGRDIYKYESIYENQRDMQNDVALALDNRVCVDPGHEDTNAIWTYEPSTCTWTPSCSGNLTLNGNRCDCNLAQKTENNIIYTVDSNCNYQATGCAITTSSSGDFTYSYSLPNCTATKSGCTNTKKKLSGESCVCNDPATKTDATYKYTLDSNCTYQKTGCVNSKKTFNSSSKTCVCSNKSSCNTTTNDFNESNCTCTPNACSTTEINKKLQSANSSCRNAASALIAYCFKNMYSTCTKSCSNASACCSATASYVGMSVAQMIKSGRSVPAACR